ncbi:Na(+)/H(+) antiporter subunit A [Brumimicrobium salinarum]|uniref:Na(+)/H(+) antiporter subunit A n=1 Tax=Brumimicrobium salinarum TaxID=2058658 RepID=A0A2I0R1P5_9FLAO|nr:hydrogen gas-evolving membrane-bound hydrogenase subunit E [Brumimicrobium salinarum]PKR80511.1 Na(+)/H(+) antiporter subunit A [Brumimicrobium salinarum]
MTLFLYVILAPFLFAILLFGIGQQNFKRITLLASILPIALFGYFLSLTPTVINGDVLTSFTEWVPSLGINLDFRLDNLALLFSLLITGVGSIVFLYTSQYLKGHPKLLRFYIFLTVFMGAMIGLVTSNNILTLFIFWELTSISSFFLISFNNTEASSRKSAIIALTITGLGGLALLAFAVLAGELTGTYSIAEMLQSPEVFANNAYTSYLILFLFLAAFTKSAQFPFHFWLPGAMKAPTPVSTYLHSATMVKAGIYLLLRFTPHFNGNESFFIILLFVGGFTMLYAAINTLFKTDLKGILAYSTIGALGIIVFLIGIGTAASITAAIVFIVVHALYKASLFLVTGTIDHQAGTRDITKLGGLRKALLPLAIAGFIAALSSGGFPPTIGFIGKDLIYESTLNASINPTLLTTIAVITNIFMVFAGLIVGVKPFSGSKPESLGAIKKPHFILWLMPMLLAALSLIFGLFPQWVEVLFTHQITPLLTSVESPHLAIWHGFNLILLLSAITIISGIIIYFFWKPNHRKEQQIKRIEYLSPRSISLQFAQLFHNTSYFLTRVFQNGYLRRYIMIILVLLTLVFGIHIFINPRIFLSLKDIKALNWNEVVILFMMLISILFTVFTKSRLTAIAGMGVLGYTMCFIFVFYGAPDLAMTQFSIDTLTVILFVLVVYRLPKYLKLSNPTNRIRDGIIATSFGTFLAFTIIEIMNETPVKSTTAFYAENAYLLAKGKNVVNVILVDFRGFDTMIEVSVLSIAAIGVFALLKLHLKKHEK